MKLTRRTRPGITLVELMVAASMCIAGMWLLTWLYQQGLESFRQARAQSGLMSGQRAVVALLERDLKQNHFLDEDPTKKPNGGRRLSDQRLDKMYIDTSTNPQTLAGYTPPRGGYFFARSRPADNVKNFFEGADTNLFDSSISADHVMAFTVILPGGANFQQFGAQVPAGSGKQYFGTAAEVVYYLRRNGSTPGGTPLYDLYRQQRLAALSDDDAYAYNEPFVAAANSNPKDNIAEVIVPKSGTQIATLKDLTVPFGFPNSVRLQPPPPTPLATFRLGEDKVLSNVVSFEVKFTGGTGSLGQANGINWPTPFMDSQGKVINSDYPYDFLPGNGEFDTFSTQVQGWNAATNLATKANTAGVLKPIYVTGAQIRLRAYDPRTRATRQTTLIVDM